MTDDPHTGPLVVVGVVGKPFGVSGACYVRPDPDVEHDFAQGTRYATTGTNLVVAHRHDHGSRMILQFVDVVTREDAEALRGTVLRVDVSQVRLWPDALWAHEVIGADVVDGDGNVLGTVERLTDGPAHDYLVVARPDGGPVWIPAVDELMSIEPAGRAGAGTRGRVVVSRLPGLFDPDAADVAGTGDDVAPD